ncbi:VapE domain-containing protein [Bacteroides sedimenti]|uniref:Virulence protein E n=1 Tax=Bacteroides sedimenti TaxID=2136147 RepID=A0ABN6Z543_9BACE
MTKKIMVSRIAHHSYIEKAMCMQEVIEEIRSDKHKETIEEIRRLNAQGDSDAAARLKAKLPGYTFAGTFEGKRRAENIDLYNSQVVIDIDNLPGNSYEMARRAIQACKYTHLCFNSPRMGLKVVVRGTPIDIPQGCTSKQRIKLINSYHKKLFKEAAVHIEKITGCEVDKSGSDVARICYTCHDPAAYYSTDSVHFPVTLENDTGFKAELIRVHREISQAQDVELNASEPTGREKKKSYGMLFQALCRQLNRTQQYESGNRNNYLFALAVMCNEAGIPKENLRGLMAQRFDDLEQSERNATLESAYSNTDCHGNHPMGRTAMRVFFVQDYLERKYHFRHNVITCKLEYRRKETDEAFTDLDDMALNSLWVELCEQGAECPLPQMHSILNSDFSTDYNPLKEYFENLPQWDGTDHIHLLSEHEQTTSQQYWRLCLEKWLCAMVATVVLPDVQNHTGLILTGDQSIGKTTFARIIMPPALKKYYCEDRVSSDNKDDLTKMFQCLLINTEEIDGMSGRELNQYKALITRAEMTIRMPYDRTMKVRKRIASFMATSNNQDILTDTTGNRRFLCFETTGFDNERQVNHDQLYAQVMHKLLVEKYRFWFTREEAQMINKRNERFMQMTTEEELITTNLRKPLTGDKISYLTAGDIAELLHKRNGLNITHKGKVTIGRVMKKLGFERQASRTGAFKYKVHVINFEEVTMNKYINDEVEKEPEATQQILAI